MKNTASIIICLFGLLFSFCTNRVEPPKEIPSNVVSKDSINLTDSSGKRHGVWILYDGRTFVIPNENLNEIEVGTYVHGKKDGEWQVLAPDGKLKHTINYEYGEPKLSSPNNH